jgi:hypothetical protein
LTIEDYADDTGERGVISLFQPFEDPTDVRGEKLPQVCHVHGLGKLIEGGKDGQKI